MWHFCRIGDKPGYVLRFIIGDKAYACDLDDIQNIDSSIVEDSGIYRGSTSQYSEFIPVQFPQSPGEPMPVVDFLVRLGEVILGEISSNGNAVGGYGFKSYLSNSTAADILSKNRYNDLAETVRGVSHLVPLDSRCNIVVLRRENGVVVSSFKLDQILDIVGKLVL